MRKTISCPVLVTLMLLGWTVSLYAQKDLLFNDRMESARKLYYSGSYYAAEQAFQKLSSDIADASSSLKPEIEAYKVLCAIEMDRSNIDGLVKVFSDSYPTAPELAMVRYSLGSHYFDRGEYEKSLPILESLKENNIYKGKRVEFVFKRAYSNMRAGSLEKAEDGFLKVINQKKESQFTAPSLYYLGYVYYVGRRFEEAFPLFEKSVRDSRFDQMAAYYATECMFMMKKHSYVTHEGVNVYESASDELKPNLARMISESYYTVGDTRKAEEYLEYYKTSGTKLSRKDYYYAGMLSYNLQSYRTAIESFSQVISEKDSLGQNAFYFIANSHLNDRNKIKALDAFREASTMDYDMVIKEDAMYNYAKLSFDVNKDISQFEHYLKCFPTSGKEDVIYNYMAASFILSKDYSSAVTMLRKVRTPGVESIRNLQRAAFLEGMVLVGKGSYRKALEMFSIAVENAKYDASLGNLASFWMGECNFRDGEYAKAKAVQSRLVANPEFRLTSEYPMTLYSLAYTCFKSSDFEGARNYFSQFLDCSCRDRQYDYDAKLRSADAFFMEHSYTEAANAYNELVSSDFTSDDIYPAYQGAISYGLLGDDNRKADILAYVVRNNRTAKLYPLALYELGRTYVQLGRDTDASECFFTLVGMKSDSTFYTKSLIELAMINNNAGKYDRALDYYKSVVKEFPSSEDAQNALLGIEMIYRNINRPEEYFEYLDRIGMSAAKTDEEKEEMIFTAAEHIYRSGKYSAAMNSLQSYMSKYPQGKFYHEASFYLAESLSATGRLEAASDAYYNVIAQGRGKYRVKAMSEYAEISFKLGHYGKAANAYDNLASMVSSDKDRIDAYLGRMRSDYLNKNYEKAAIDGAMISAMEGISNEIKREAEYIGAKSLMINGERENALSIFEYLAEDKGDKYGAESAYLLINDAYNSGNFEKMENMVYDFADSKSGQLYWLARSFIVLGDSFADRQDWEQAKATFESVRSGYRSSGENDDIIEQAQMRLDRIKEMGK